MKYHNIIEQHLLPNPIKGLQQHKRLMEFHPAFQLTQQDPAITNTLLCSKTISVIFGLKIFGAVFAHKTSQTREGVRYFEGFCRSASPFWGHESCPTESEGHANADSLLRTPTGASAAGARTTCRP